MSDKLIYRDLESYSGKNNKKKIKISSYIFYGIVAVSIIFASKIIYENIMGRSKLTEEKITYYIDIADNISEGKAQVNWQEVAAINEVLNSGNEDELVPKIAEVFLKNNDEGGYSLYTLDDVLQKLKVNESEGEKIKQFLDDIKEETLYEGLYNDDAKISFIKMIYPAAVENYNKYGILPSITMAQAILESGWGESELASEHNNLFGIKADSRWDGAVATMVTSEYYNDVIEANFRKYESTSESIDDHGEFLYSNERYEVNGLFDGKDYKSQAQALEDAGYSTSQDENGEKDYAEKLINVIQKYNLMVFDTEAKR